MRVLVCHNQYQQRGGEDTVVESEVELLRARGHAVETVVRSNDELDGMSSFTMARDTLWSGRTARDVEGIVRRFRPDVIHAHNTFPLISPSLYWAVERARVPVVQTLHNFRLMCLNGLLLRGSRICEDCMGKLPWRGVTHACYRGSRTASAVLAGMLTLHRGLGTYRDKVTRYIVLNEFCRQKFSAAGLPPERLSVKPNFVDAPEPEQRSRADFLFVGRVSVEKGVDTLAQAIASYPDAQLRVVGSGAEAAVLQEAVGVIWLGSRSGEAVREEMNSALAVVVPSIWYETFGLVVIEAFACATPVIASRIGALAEMIRDGETGLLFEPGNPDDLAAKLAWARNHPEAMAAMGRQARAQYEAEFSADANYRRLMEIYEDAIAERRSQD